MKTGISTASLFFRKPTEDAIQFLAENNVGCAEVFLESYCEYKSEFGQLIKDRKGNIPVHSVHTLTTQFEPQLYSINERAKKDSFALLEQTMSTAKLFGAKYYTFHGGARFKKTPFSINYERVGAITQQIIDVTKKYGVDLAYENVHWGYYNYIGFFKEIKKIAPSLKGTFDIKQARQSGIFYGDYISEMGENIVTAHLSDYADDGKMCLPGKGVTDFKEVFMRLNDVGFDGALILEVYQNDYKEESELLDCYENITYLAEKVFGKKAANNG